MIEVSPILLTLLAESVLVLGLVLLVWVILAWKRKGRDRRAVKKLVDQIKHQSKTRLETTGSFLSDKYRFEGDELQKAVEMIDRAEKKFIQHLIQVYLKRDSHGLAAMDAKLAELIDSYKSLSPVMPDKETMSRLEVDHSEALEELREVNEKLREELAITKETMGNMISEFGNMFGGGHEHNLDQQDVVKKVVERKPHAEKEDKDGKESAATKAATLASDGPGSTVAVTGEPAVSEDSAKEGPGIDGEQQADARADSVVSVVSDPETEEPALKSVARPREEEVLSDEGIDDLLSGVVQEAKNNR